MLKKEARKLYKERRNALSLAERTKMDDLMLIRFQQLHPSIPTTVMTYSPIESFNEFDPHYVLSYCRFRNPGLVLVYPVMDKTHPYMEPVVVHMDTAFEANEWNIEEPLDGTPILASAIDMILVPLLAFDEQGTRVGYGKGYYDRFLSNCRENVIKVGFSYFDPLPLLEDKDTFDIPLSFCITPGASFEF